MLLARRLVEAGVTFVTVNAGRLGHARQQLRGARRQKLPQFDAAWAALMQDLHSRGMLKNTLVLVWGEFGRTPRINKDAGRDHWPGAQSVVLAGGGLKHGPGHRHHRRQGRISQGAAALARGRAVDDVQRRWASTRNIEFLNEAQRPFKILNSGEPIKELVG